MMALNIATLGHFDWASKVAPAPYSIFNHDLSDAVGVGSNQFQTHEPNDKRNLSADDLGRAILVFDALSKEQDDQVVPEYLKGIFHLGLTFFELTFRKDAFANFYRSLEHFLTGRVLGGKKIKNEVKEFTGAMRTLEVSEEVIQNFSKRLYPLRCEQVMHSQKSQREIEMDDVLHIKILTDAVMSRVYKPLWETERR